MLCATDASTLGDAGKGWEWTACDEVVPGSHLFADRLTFFCADCGVSFGVRSYTACGELKRHKHEGCRPYAQGSPETPAPLELQRRNEWVNGVNRELKARLMATHSVRSALQQQIHADTDELCSVRNQLRLVKEEEAERSERAAAALDSARREARVVKERAAELEAECTRLRRRSGGGGGGGDLDRMVRALRRVMKTSSRKRKFLALLHPDKMTSESMIGSAKFIRDTVNLD